MAYIFKNGKAVLVSIGDVKIPKRVEAKVDSNKESRKIVNKVIKSVRSANVKYEF